MSTAPTMLMGLVPLIRATARSAATAALTTTVTPDDSGTMFISLTTGTHAYTLPAVAASAGKCFIFAIAEMTAGKTVASTAANIVGIDSVTGTTLTSAAAAGGSITLVSDGVNYIVIGSSGTWTIA